jgi:hypothetical protein
VKLEWKKGTVSSEKKSVRSAATRLLEKGLVSHLLPIARSHPGGKGRVRVFDPFAMADLDVEVQDRGERVLRNDALAVKARELVLSAGPFAATLHLDDRKRAVRVAVPLTGLLAELEGFEGLRAESVEVARPEGVEESDVTVRSGRIALAGSLTKPKGGRGLPAVLLLSTFGAQDRNGPQGGAPLYRVLAYALSLSGALVLRLDDRGCGSSEGDAAAAKPSDLAADASAALAFLRSREDVASLVLLGHGEGATLALLVAGRDAVSGLLLLGAPARPLDVLLLERHERELSAQGVGGDLRDGLLARQRRVFDEIRRAKGDTLVLDERRTFIGGMKEHFALDPAALLGRLKVPVALLHGTLDEEVPASHADLLRKARPDVPLLRIEGADHGFSREGRIDEDFVKALAAELLRVSR